MDEKKVALFSKALLILWEGFCEEHGCTPIGSKVVVVDAEENELERPAVS